MVIINNQYTHADDYGSYTVCFSDRIIEVKYCGFLTEPLIEKFCEDLELTLRVVDWEYWGYYGDFTECDDQSIDILNILTDLCKRFLLNGCVVDAYTITNPMIIEHVTKLRKSANVELDKNLFPSRQQAIDFIHGVLLKIEKSQNN